MLTPREIFLGLTALNDLLAGHTRQRAPFGRHRNLGGAGSEHKKRYKAQRFHF
jgi:hypothetical protein